MADQAGKSAVQQQQQQQDCLGCRVLGCLFGVGGGGYLASGLLASPPPKGAHRAGIIIAAGSMFVFGMYRALF